MSLFFLLLALIPSSHRPIHTFAHAATIKSLHCPFRSMHSIYPIAYNQQSSYRIVLTTATFIVPISLTFIHTRPFFFFFSMVPLSYLIDNTSICTTGFRLASTCRPKFCIGSYLLLCLYAQLMVGISARPS